MMIEKGRRLTVSLALAGFLVAVVVWAYSELTDAGHVNMPVWTVFVILCPPSLLTVPLIDVEPGSIDFAFVWFVVALLNAGLYVLVGKVIAHPWKKDP
jgi:hypothetical protein